VATKPPAGFSLPLRFADLERGLLAWGHAFFGHRQQHRDRHVGSSDSRQIHDLLLAEQLLCTLERLVGNLVLCGKLGYEIVDDDLVGLHVRGPLVRLEFGHDFRGKP
jgi:hypothetical protein